jgi:hypothetical protein
MNRFAGGVRGWLAVVAACWAVAGLVLPATAQEAVSAGLKLRVTEVAQTVDLGRGGEKFLTVTVEITGAQAGPLRRVQPLRDDFQVLAGKSVLACRWLRGGSVPEDPRRLRFTLGFSLPPKVATVSLRANLPRLEGEETVELRLADLQAADRVQERRGAGWQVTVDRFGERSYEPPALPEAGKFFSKGGPVDFRVFRKGGAGDPVPGRVIGLTLVTRDVELYDRTVDVSGSLLLDRGAGPALLSASMRRDPARSVAKPPYAPFVTGQFFFPIPAQGRVTGAVIRLHRRPRDPGSRPVVIDGLPVPG